MSMSAVVHHAARGTSRRSAERRSFGRRVRRFGLGVFFASIAVNAALGIYAVLAPDFGETQGKILGTSLCVTGAVVLALACEPAWERKLLGPVPAAGAVLGAVGFALAVAGIWTEPESEIWGKTMGNIFTVAVACAVASLLVLARLSPRHGWIFVVTLALLGVGTALIGLLPWLGDDPAEAYLRALGVVLIVLAAFVVTVPVMHWIDHGALVAAEAVIGTVRYCPYCGKEFAATLDVELQCTRCGRGFRVETVPSSGNGQGAMIGS
jgi:ribosomal protein S27AE